MGMFDDLIAQHGTPRPTERQSTPSTTPTRPGMFDDLVERAQASRVETASRSSERGSILDPLAQGISFGLADEVGGAAAGAYDYLLGSGDFGGTYATTRDDLRANKAAYAERQPWVSPIAEFAGALPTALIPAGTVARGASLGARIGRGAGAGAAAGAAQGFGSAEGGLANRSFGLGAGMAAGAGVGAALPAAAGAVGAGARAGRDLFAPNELTKQGIGRRAQQAMFETLDRDAMTAAEAARRAQAYGPDAMLADTSPALRAKADTLAHFNRPGARENLVEPLRARAEGRRGAVGAMFDDVLGPQPDMPAMERYLRQQQRTNANQTFEAARKANGGKAVNTTALLQNIASDVETPIEALSSGTGRFKDLPETKVAREFVQRLESEGGGQITDFDQLSRVQQVVYKQARTLLKSADGQQKLAGSQLMKYHDDLIAAMDEASGGLYSKARGRYADDAAVRDALDRGRGVFGRDEHPQYLAEEAGRMSQPAYDMLLASARDEARRVMSSSRGDLTAASALAAPGSAMRENLAAILMRQGPAGEAQLEKITERARGEVEKRLTERIGGNSQTARRVQDPDSGQGGRIPLDVGATGLALRGAQRLAEAMAPDFGKGRAEGLSKLLGAQGSERANLVRLLVQEEIKRNGRLTPARAAMIDKLITTRAPLALSPLYGGD